MICLLVTQSSTPQLGAGLCLLLFSCQIVSNSLRPHDCSPPSSSLHGISQARILEWVAIPFSRDLLDPGMKPPSPALQVNSLLFEPPRKAGVYHVTSFLPVQSLGLFQAQHPEHTSNRPVIIQWMNKYWKLSEFRAILSPLYVLTPGTITIPICQMRKLRHRG